MGLNRLKHTKPARSQASGGLVRPTLLQPPLAQIILVQAEVVPQFMQ